MLVKVYARGLGCGIKGATIFSALSLGRIHLKKYKSDKNEEVLRLVDDFCVGQKTSATFWVEIETDWFRVHAPSGSWIYNTTELLHTGTKMEIEFKKGDAERVNQVKEGDLAGRMICGTINVILRKVLPNGTKQELLGETTVKSCGTLYAPIILNAQVKYDPKDHRIKYRYRRKANRQKRSIGG